MPHDMYNPTCDSFPFCTRIPGAPPKDRAPWDGMTHVEAWFANQFRRSGSRQHKRKEASIYPPIPLFILLCASGSYCSYTYASGSQTPFSRA